MKAFLPILTVATCLLTLPAQAGTGDLDPSFADHGRQAPIGGTDGAALFAELLPSGRILIGGADVDVSGNTRLGPERCTLRITGSNFASEVDADGEVYLVPSPPGVSDIAAYGMARQADGKIVVIGRKIRLVSSYGCRHSFTPTVFRLNSNGSLDSAFGVINLRGLAGLRSAKSLDLDPQGRIVIAGVRSIQGDPMGRDGLVVLRLGSDGVLDGSFGEGGIYVGPRADSWDQIGVIGSDLRGSGEIRLIRASSGSYRVSVLSKGTCNIIGITANGALDTAFGSAGVVTQRGAGGAGVTCNALESEPEGGLLLAGSSRKKGFVARLLANGMPVQSFNADAAIAGVITKVTSIANAADGKLLIAGTGPRGASIVRLQGNGERDAAFGEVGRTWIDLYSDFASNAIVQDMLVREDGSVIAVGGKAGSDEPFVVRLLGDAGGISRGVISFSRWSAAPTEADGKAILRVRRSGGHSGNVSATYRTMARDATDHEDFVPKSGRLDWVGGDTSEQAIVFDIIEGGDTAEARESFQVMLEDVRGGAGLGTRGATVDIQPDGSPGGQLEIDMSNMNPSPLEAHDTYQVALRRNYHFEGRVCVTLTAKSGTARAGQDFGADPVTACWDDQQGELQLPNVQLFDDDRQEGTETFTLELSNPTGGAIIGPIGSVTVTLRDDD